MEKLMATQNDFQAGIKKVNGTACGEKNDSVEELSQGFAGLLRDRSEASNIQEEQKETVEYGAKKGQEAKSTSDLKKDGSEMLQEAIKAETFQTFCQEQTAVWNSGSEASKNASLLSEAVGQYSEEDLESCGSDVSVPVRLYSISVSNPQILSDEAEDGMAEAGVFFDQEMSDEMNLVQSDTVGLERTEERNSTLFQKMESVKKQDTSTGEEIQRNTDKTRDQVYQTKDQLRADASELAIGSAVIRQEPLKAAESSNAYIGEKTLTTSLKQLPEDLGRTLASKLSGKPQVLELTLEPVSLGRLTIRASYEGGRATISIMASDRGTLEILHQKAADLAGMLEERTGQLTMIYTQGTEEQYSWEADRGNQEKPDQQEKKQNRKSSDSFVQQLRLGLV